jgi:hypothetical protein
MTASQEMPSQICKALYAKLQAGCLSGIAARKMSLIVTTPLPSRVTGQKVGIYVIPVVSEVVLDE